jgi:hypothetical protein
MSSETTPKADPFLLQSPEAAYTQGREMERAHVVAWLRAREKEANAKLDEDGAYPDWFEHERDIYWSAANAIGRGDHAS